MECGSVAYFLGRHPRILIVVVAERQTPPHTHTPKFVCSIYGRKALTLISLFGVFMQKTLPLMEWKSEHDLAVQIF